MFTNLAFPAFYFYFAEKFSPKRRSICMSFRKLAETYNLLDLARFQLSTLRKRRFSGLSSCWNCICSINLENLHHLRISYWSVWNSRWVDRRSNCRYRRKTSWAIGNSASSSSCQKVFYFKQAADTDNQNGKLLKVEIYKRSFRELYLRLQWCVFWACRLVLGTWLGIRFWTLLYSAVPK